MDAFLSSPVPVFPPFKRFICLSSEFLAAKTRPRQAVPRHAVFDLCQRVLAEAVALEGEMGRHLSHLKVRLIEFARSELERRKLERNVQSFDDLLLRVARAAAATPAAGGLIESVRRKYRAVLVDEFQDTDELQVHDFFAAVFRRATAALSDRRPQAGDLRVSRGGHLLLPQGGPQRRIDLHPHREPPRGARTGHRPQHRLFSNRASLPVSGDIVSARHGGSRRRGGPPDAVRHLVPRFPAGCGRTASPSIRATARS